MSRPLIHGKTPDVDRERVGISYSGGGPLVLVELGIAQAFVDLKIPITAIAGVSAGALAGTAHALDPKEGKGIAAAAQALQGISDRTLKLDAFDIVLDALKQGIHLRSIGDNSAIQQIVERVFGQLDAVQRILHQPGHPPYLTVEDFGTDGRPRLFIGATDRLEGEAVWFPASTRVAEALVASSAIPGVFPWKEMTVDGEKKTLVDGGVANNQPLSELVLEAGCGWIYSCGVGYDGGRLKAPVNLLDNALQSISIVAHQAVRLEQECVELKLGDQGQIHHIHPEVTFPVHGYNFSDPAVIREVMGDACTKTKAWIQEQKLLPPQLAAVGGSAD